MDCPHDRRRYVGAHGDVLGEPQAQTCIAALEIQDDILISAATLAEALIVSDRRNVAEEVTSLIEGLRFKIVDVTPAAARRVAQAYARWGKGIHAAALNFGDCFACDVAKEHACPLLFVGADFAKTDVEPAI